MQPDIEKLVNETRTQTGLQYNIIDFNYARFKSNGRKLIIMFDKIVLNFVDIDCKSNDIICDPLTLEFDKPLPDFTHIGVDTLEYNEENQELRINDTIYHLLSEYDVALFVTDLGVQVKQAMENLFKTMKAKLVQ